MIAALFVETNGCYFGLPDVDPWDIHRDARTYVGPHPVVAHPPCARWCAFAALNESKLGLKIGDDAGCFESALAAVEKWGGVLEHPRASKAWVAHGIEKPPKQGWKRTREGWTCQVEQGHYGHGARKGTWLYAVAAEVPELVWGKVLNPTARIGGPRPQNRVGLKHLRGAEALATPLPFRDVLLNIARNTY